MNWSKIWLLCIFTAVLPNVQAHSINNKKIKRIEPVANIQYKIAPRTSHFFAKRHQSASTYQSKTVEYDDTLQLRLEAYNTTFHLHLEPNLDLFHPEAVVHHQGLSTMLPVHQVFKGHVVVNPEREHQNLGWARILVRNDLKPASDEPIVIEGAFSFHGDLYHIKTTENYKLVRRSVDPDHPTTSSRMVIYRDSDTTSLSIRDMNQPRCGFDKLLHKSTHTADTTESDVFNVISTTSALIKRFNDGCPATKKINYMGAAADCTYVRYYKSTDAARIQIINDFNMVSAVYEETFNIALGLINITIMDSTCPTIIEQQRGWNRACDPNYSLGDRLSDFSQWRAKMSDDGAGLWHLMTNCPMGVEVGLAWLKQLCNSKATVQTGDDGSKQYVSGAGVSAITVDEWKVMAHEIGHGFGAIHDCSADTCPCSGSDCQCCPLSATQCDSGSAFLMSPISNTSAKYFSPCTVNTICSAFPSLGGCLSDPQEHTHHMYQLNVCGNGIKEAGEECDTGGQETSCCNAMTCTLKQPAVCEDKNDGCCHDCQLRPSSYICRPAATSCDSAEYCSGTSATCPDDIFVQDGTSCSNSDNSLQCASGICTSRDAQCLSRGFVMNITQSCQSNNEECKILCNQPGSNSKCLLFSGNFIDGTPCGMGGSCLAGDCQNSSVTTWVWIQQHGQILIPVIVALFILVSTVGFLVFWFGCWGCPGYKDKKTLKSKLPMYSDKNNGNDSSCLTINEQVASTNKDVSKQQQEEASFPTGISSLSSSLTVIVNNRLDEKKLEVEQ